MYYIYFNFEVYSCFLEYYRLDIFQSFLGGTYMFSSIFGTLISFFMPFIYIIIIIMILILVIFIVFVFFKLYYRVVEGLKPEGNDCKVIKDNFIKKIFYLFPKQLAYDSATKNMNDFQEYGIHIIVGPQGSGKTMLASYLLRQWKQRYPNMKIYSNIQYDLRDQELNSWDQLILQQNGSNGIVNFIDEIKTWWSQKDSKDIPPEVLGEICQQRKQRKAIIGTVQVFEELARPLRKQTHYIYLPHTFFGCFTFVFKSEARYYDKEKDTFKKHTGFFFFPHTKELRNSYDTYEKVQKYKDKEFGNSVAFRDLEVFEDLKDPKPKSRISK